MSRFNQIKLFFKTALSNVVDEFLESNDLPVVNIRSHKDLITFVQEKLIDAGYPLSRYGADGIIGRETIRAINNFRRDINKDEVQLSSETLLDQSDVSKLTHYADLSDEAITERLRSTRTRSLEEIAESITPSSSESRSTSGETYMFGDSQMQATALGPFFEKKYGAKPEAEPGWQAKSWLNDSRFLSALEKRPSRMVFQLNSNGIAKTKELLEKIFNTSPNTEVIWYGAPPATLKSNSSYSVVRTESSLASFNERRMADNVSVEGLLSSSGLRYTFINPFTDIPGLTNWSCSESLEPCDGIHITLSIADKYYI